MRKKLTLLLAWLALFAAAAGLLTAVGNLTEGRAEEELRQVEQAVRRAAVTCCAAEGTYPAELEHLKTHYGLQVDEQRYTIYYDVFAENLLPEITVLRNGG